MTTDASGPRTSPVSADGSESGGGLAAATAERLMRLLDARLRLSEHSLVHTLDDLLRATLDEGEALTGSTMGFFHFVQPDQRTLSLQNWSTRTIAELCQADGRGRHYDLDLAGVWADSVRERRPVIHNDYPDLAHRRGLPPGHAPLLRELVVPVLRNGLVVAVVGLGNKPAAYDDEDVHTLDTLANLAWDLVVRKRAEEARHEADSNLRALLDATTQSAFLLNHQGIVLAGNEMSAHRVGLPISDWIGSCVFSLVAPDLAAGWRADLRRLFETGRPYRVRVEWNGRDFEMNHFPVFTSDGAVRGAAVFAEDVSERLRVEEALRRSQRELAAIYDHAPVMMCVLDRSRRVAYANRAFAEFVGRPAPELLHERACGVIGCLRALDAAEGCGFGPSCAECGVRRAILDTLETGRSHRDLEYRATIRREGQPDRHMVFLASVAAIDLSGQAHLLLCLDDITEREQASEQLRLSREELRGLAANVEAARERDRIHVAREIHDVLAQDLTRLKIDLTRLQGQLRPAASPGHVDRLDVRVGEMVQTVDATIRNVQRIATELRPAVLDGLGLTAAVEWHVREFQQRCGIGCRLTLPPAEPAVAGDVATAAFRILQESLTNVARHAAASEVAVMLRYDADGLMMRVADNGRGIPENALRSPLSIGLVGMRERALLLDGHFSITSHAGIGTVVDVRLPLTRSVPGTPE